MSGSEELVKLVIRYNLAIQKLEMGGCSYLAEIMRTKLKEAFEKDRSIDGSWF